MANVTTIRRRVAVLSLYVGLKSHKNRKLFVIDTTLFEQQYCPIKQNQPCIYYTNAGTLYFESLTSHNHIDNCILIHIVIYISVVCQQSHTLYCYYIVFLTTSHIRPFVCFLSHTLTL